MKFLLAVVAAALFAIAQPVFATAQQPDILVLDGEQLWLLSNPLSPLVEAGRITLPKPDEQWSSNWRGYVATWGIADGRLVLDKIDVLLVPENGAGNVAASPVNVLPRLFPGQTRVPADWFSGTLVVPRGKMLAYVHMGYASLYERYTVVRIESGRVLRRSDLSAREYVKLRKKRFAAYQKTEAYAARLKQGLEKLSERQAKEFLFEFAVEEYMSAPQ